MDYTVLDNDNISRFDNEPSVAYGGFWRRFAAVMLDGLILSPVNYGLVVLNILYWKSPLVYIIAFVISLLYKPFMEARWGATVGKMAAGIRVVDTNYMKADLNAVLLRNIFNIVPALITLVVTIPFIFSEDFRELESFMEYSQIIASYSILTVVNGLSGILGLTDLIMMLSDERRQSLHDRIGKTFVIRTSAL